MQPPGMWIHGIGLTTALGSRPAAVAAAARAGISRRSESVHLNRDGDPMIVSPVPDDDLPPLADALVLPSARHRRLLRLATVALQQAVTALDDPRELPLLLALPESHPALPRFEPGALLAGLRAQTGVPLALARSSAAYHGRAGAIAALADAHARPFEASSPFVLVGGLDSYLDAELLAALDHERRVLAVGVRDGFAPGEGAGFLLLSQRRVVDGARARFFVAAPGLGHEAGHRYGDTPHLGDGLADAVRAALQRAPAGGVRSVYASLNGEHDGAREWGVAAVRNHDAFADDCGLEHPADCLGDVGAAVGPILIALATVGLERGYCAGPSLVWCASDGPQRAAVLVIDDPREETT